MKTYITYTVIMPVYLGSPKESVITLIRLAQPLREIISLLPNSILNDPLIQEKTF